MTIRSLVLATLIVAPVGAALAMPQPPASVSRAATVTETFTITAIDYQDRLVTLRDVEGYSETIACGPEVQRFDALKVGDTVTVRYEESVVYDIARPGATSRPAESAKVTRNGGTRPGGTMAQTLTAVVTIAAIDAKAPAVTVTTQDGRKMAFKVEDASNLTGLKVGDRVEITYTRAVASSVASGSK